MNVFGERQHPEKFIPMTIQRVRDSEKVFIHANKEKTKAGSRHYIHAQDVADGLMFILSLKIINIKEILEMLSVQNLILLVQKKLTI